MADREESQQENGNGRLNNLRLYLAEDVTESWGDIVLIICCFITGLLDSAVFNLYSAFVSMQTGNTVYVGLGVSGQPLSSPYRWVKSLLAIVAFMLGSFFFSRFMRYLSPLHRGTMFISFLLQALLCIASAILIQTDIVPNDAASALPHSFIVLLPLGLLSFQSAGQIVMSRVLGYNGLPTVVLTSTYCDLLFDPQVLVAPILQNASRNRRIASIVMVLLGAILGGFLTKGGRLEGTLWIAGGIKTAIAFSWIFWKSKGVQLE